MLSALVCGKPTKTLEVVLKSMYLFGSLEGSMAEVTVHDVSNVSTIELMSYTWPLGNFCYLGCVFLKISLRYGVTQRECAIR